MLYLYPYLNAFSWGIKDLVLLSGALLFTAFCLVSYPVKTNRLHGGIQGFAAVEIILCPPTPSTREIMLSVLSYLLLKNCFWIIPHSADVRMCCFGRHKNERADANLKNFSNHKCFSHFGRHKDWMNLKMQTLSYYLFSVTSFWGAE